MSINKGGGQLAPPTTRYSGALLGMPIREFFVGAQGSNSAGTEKRDNFPLY
jgi:hypothetical protein